MRQNYKKRLNLFGIVVILFGLPFLFNLKNLANLLGFFFGMVNHPCVLIKMVSLLVILRVFFTFTKVRF